MTGARIALLLSGLPRQWKPCLQSQFELLKTQSFDVFFHFWDTIEEQEKREIIDFLKPKAYRFEKPRDFSSYDTDPRIQRDRINVPSRLVSQYASWKAVAELFEPYKTDYALAMRTRADLQFVYGMENVFSLLNPHEILAPLWSEKEIISDVFAIGGVEPILYYHKLFDHLFDYAPQFEFSPEYLITWHIRSRKGFHLYMDSSRNFFIRRPHMENYTLEQAMAEDPGRNKWLDPKLVDEHKTFHNKVAGEEGRSFIEAYSAGQIDQLGKETRTKLGPKD